MLSTLMKTTSTDACSLNDFTVNNTETELVNVHYQQNDDNALLDYIKSGSDQGWILFLAPPGKPSTTFFEQAGINKNRILMIDSSKVDDNLALLSTLLKSGNYSTVITWVNDLTEQIRLNISADAQTTNTGCFIYCNQ